MPLTRAQALPATVSATWGADTANPTLGNGTMTCKVTKRDGNLKIDGSITMGSTTTYGTGDWFIQLPAPYATLLATANAMGACYVLDSGTAFFTGVAKISANAGKVYFSIGGQANNVRATVPQTWAVNDVLQFSIEFPIQ
jgi:hypothetical protein